jgi:hypothetical protein
MRQPSTKVCTVYQEALNAKREATKISVTLHLKQVRADTAKQGRGIWQLAK